MVQSLKTTRELFHQRICDLVGPDVSVYYQPPSSVKMKYPCLVYELSYIDNMYADDGVWMPSLRYDLMVIDRNPDSYLVDLVSTLPYCSFDRAFVSDGLNHTVFRVYVSE